MNKAFCCWSISNHLNLPYTKATLKGMTLSQLKSLIPPMELESLKIKYQLYLNKIKTDYKLSLQELKNLAIKRDLTYSNLNKVELVNNIKNKEAIIPDELDSDQQMVIDQSYQVEKMLIFAGPGSGKTTTLAKLISCHASKRILVLSFTNSAVSELKRKLKAYGTSVEKNVELGFNGVYLLTFHKYIWKRLTRYDLDFRQGFLAGLAAGIQHWEHWDMLIVDETQDVLAEHFKLIKQIAQNTKQLIFAGDPRQEVYPGSTFFSLLWRQKNFKKFKLRYNHRSCPKIVSMLNQFSAVHFPEFHYQQIAANKENGIMQATVEENSIDDISKILVNQDSYLISPVSVKKYSSTDSIMTQLRQSVFSESQGSKYLKVVTQENKTSKTNLNLSQVIYAGTSYFLKGTERESVAIVQANIPYHKLNLTYQQTIRLIFVALSRAKKNLYLFLDSPIKSDGILACIADCFNLKVSKKKHYIPLTLPTRLSVVDDLLDCQIPFDSQDIADINKLDLSLAEAPDFCGLYVEGLICNYLGVPLLKNQFDQFKLLVTSQPKCTYLDNSSITIEVNKKNKKKTAQALKKLVTEMDSNSEFWYAKLRYSLVAKDWWTLGDKLTQPKVENFLKKVTQKQAREIKNHLGQGLIRQNKYNLCLQADRSNLVIGNLIGVTDLETKDKCLEIKHCHKTEMTHFKQTCIYHLLSGKKGFLFNAKTGQFSDVKTSLTQSDVLHLARAVLASKQAQILKSRLQHCLLSQHDTPSVLVSIDIETYGNQIIEIGAVAFSPGGFQVISSFHQIASGVTQDSVTDGPAKFIYQLTGLNPTRMHSDLTLKKSFYHWMKNFNTAPVIQWAGSDTKKLGLNNSSIDVSNYFRAWLEQIDCQRSHSYTLSDAVLQLSGCDLFCPHRAFEDAVATMLVYLVINK